MQIPKKYVHYFIEYYLKNLMEVPIIQKERISFIYQGLYKIHQSITNAILEKKEIISIIRTLENICFSNFLLIKNINSFIKK
jgi:hypothetical protein